MNAYRPTPTAASRRLHALKFIQDYWAKNGESPSFGEIAAAIGAEVPTVSRIVRQLDRAGHVIHVPGQRRGILLPDAVDHISTDDALRVLRKRGWTIPEDINPLATFEIDTKSQLTMPDGFDDIP